jgi:hypothetical protein
VSRDRFLALADRLRSKAGPATLAGTPGFDVRTNAVTIRARTWTSGKIQVPWPATAGTDYADVDLVLTPRPKVRRISSSLVASSGGRYEQNDMIVGPITPAYPGPPAGGYTLTQLDPLVPPGTKNVEKLWLISGPDAGVYRLVDMRNDRAFRYEAVIRKLRDTP